MFSAALFAPAMEKTIDSQHLDKPIVDAKLNALKIFAKVFPQPSTTFQTL